MISWRNCLLFPVLALLVVASLTQSLAAHPRVSNFSILPAIADTEQIAGEDSGLGHETWRGKISQDYKISPELYAVTFLGKLSLEISDLKELDKNLLFLHLPYFSNVMEVYLNGQKLDSSGEVLREEGKPIAIAKNGYRRHWTPILPRSLLQEQNEIRLVLFADKDDYFEMFDSWHGVPLGVFWESEISHLSEETTLHRFIFLYFCVGIYHLVLFAKRNREWDYFFFGMFSLGLSAYIYIRTTRFYEYGLDSIVQSKIEYCLVFPLPAILLMFVEYFFQKKITKFTLSYFCYLIFLCLLCPWVGKNHLWMLLSAWQYSIFPSILYGLFLLVDALRKKLPDSLLISLGFFITLLCVLLDLVGAVKITTAWKDHGLVRYGFFFLVLGVAGVLGNRFLRFQGDLEVMNQTLEQKVKERTEELESAYKNLENLKEQQDGDYFLISLLLEPVQFIQNPFPNLKVNSLLQQKKKFPFRGSVREIGGDSNFSAKITLADRDYLFFSNSDAMGKSLQGAVGAFFYGVNLQGLLQHQSHLTPNQWLVEAFREVHQAFLAFDGSMLISFWAGVLDPRTGDLVYANSDHPEAVLLRDKKANFLTKTIKSPKLGLPLFLDRFHTQTTKLEPGDVLFLGSDGRDDLSISKSSATDLEILQDPDLFRGAVERSQGEISSVLEILQSQGEFTDDLSLLRIELVSYV